MTGMTALLLFAAWTLLLMFGYVTYRTMMVMRGSSAASWTRGSGYEVPGLVKRVENAHANCVENLPVYGAIVLGAYVLGKPGIVDATALWFLLARLGQSITHIAGVTHALVLVRAVFFTVQVLVMLDAIRQLLA
jgi:uncharacterized MAPEG superfamily protein